VLAICYGLQLLNVHFGGTLVQDIPSEVRGDIDHDLDERPTEPLHAVRVEAGGDSRLFEIVAQLPQHSEDAPDRRAEILVNSSHHQSICEPGRGLRVTARAPDGVIEAVEWSSVPAIPRPAAGRRARRGRRTTRSERSSVDRRRPVAPRAHAQRSISTRPVSNASIRSATRPRCRAASPAPHSHVYATFIVSAFALSLPPYVPEDDRCSSAHPAFCARARSSGRPAVSFHPQTRGNSSTPEASTALQPSPPQHYSPLVAQSFLAVHAPSSILRNLVVPA